MTDVQPHVRILYMEDDPGLARLMRKTLRKSGFILETAGDGEEGLAMAAAQKFDILLVDYNMPVKSGIEVLRTLSAEGNTTPVIMVTGSGNERVAVEALKLGATDYVVKDLEMGYLDILPIIIEQVLDKQRLIRERDEMLIALKRSEEGYRRLVELSPDGIALLIGGRIAFLNPAGMKMLGLHEKHDLSARPMAELLHPDFRDVFAGQLHQVAVSGDCSDWLEERMLRADGSEVEVEATVGGSFTYLGEQALQFIFRDITERNEAKRRLEQLAHFDNLTGLPNRSLFFDRLSQAFNDARRYGRMMALFYLDLDRFKAVNDTLGHDVGDMVLVETTQRLKNAVRACDSVARMGGDEFTVILGAITEERDAAVIAQRIVEAVAKPYHPGGKTCSLGVSIGIAIYPSDCADAETLLKRADTAMYRVKKVGKNGYLIHTDREQNVESGRRPARSRCRPKPW